MIHFDETIEYSHVITDLINELATGENYKVSLWVDGSELPIRVCTGDTDVEFLTDAIKIYRGTTIEYVLYGILRVIKCTKMNG